jgi:AAA15 family ATPase/GTPase
LKKSTFAPIKTELIMEKTTEHQPAYISRVHLKGYKSIRDLEIDFKAGLNIIIGPNGSGKTNFLGFLSDTYTGMDDFDNIIGNEVDFTLDAQVKEGIFTHKIKGEFELVKENFIFKIRETLIENKIIKEDDEVHYSNGNSKSVVKYIEHHIVENMDDRKNRFSYIYEVVSIKYNNTFNNFLLTPIAFKFRRKGNKVFKLSDFDNDFDSMPFFTHIEFKKVIQVQEDEKPNLIANLHVSDKLVAQLAIYTPIKSLKFDENSHWQVEENDELILNGVRLLFKVNDKWWTWNQLSDGTKRMFYIFCNVLHWNQLYVFIEEPELGIHPDQLYLLMDFLKEQSQTKQIIITTHSPEVLNILGKDELDRIIVTRYDAEKGTQMHHLSPKKIRKGVSYMSKEGLTLKDFWVHSNLEEYDEEEYEIR